MRTMDYIFNKHPELLGLTATIAGVMQSFIDYATPAIQFIGLCVGIAIGVVTLLIKIKELKKK